MIANFNNNKIASLLLRFGIAFTFFYAAIFSFLNPNDWIGFFPLFLRDIFSDNLLILFFSFYELILGFWIISGKFQFYSAVFSALTVLGIIVFNLGILDIVFRDVAIFFSALALIFINSGNWLKKS